ncbi:MFS transporter [Spirochaeta cellobiosiphila]|uniref:MFS transporter n=1 Tax=Spirochaeta cellobiosiphila TaxID=504483 RepID=UPI0003FF5468|nr:MFS transporter [Spirochaeta cellobiosiphila]
MQKRFLDIIKPQRFPFFYGWLIVFVGVAGSIMSVPGQTIGVSVFTDHLINTLAITRDSLSLAYLIGTIGSALVLSYSGLLLDKIGSQKFGIIISFCLGLVLVLLSFVGSFLEIMQNLLPGLSTTLLSMILISLGFFLIRFLGQGSLTIVSRNLPMKWFTSYRGRINAVAGAFITFGFNGAPKLFSLLIDHFTWQGTWRILGFIIMITGVILFGLFAKERPEDYGLTQDGLGNSTNKNTINKVKPQVEDKELAFVRTDYVFWIFIGIICMNSLYGTGLTFHIVSIFTQNDLSPDMAVSIFIPSAIISVIVNFVASGISDFVKMKYILMLQAFGILLTTLSTYFLAPGIAVFGIILGNGIAGGLMNLLLTVTWPRFYGTKHLGAISGFAMTFIVAGSALGPFILSKSLTVFGSYGNAALFIASLTALLFVGALFIREPKP